MTLRQPTFFIPHGGGPCFFLDPAGGPPDPMWRSMQAYLAGLIASLPERPKAFLLISGHWEEEEVVVDRYASLEDAMLRRQRVTSDAGQAIGAAVSAAISCEGPRSSERSRHQRQRQRHQGEGQKRERGFPLAEGRVNAEDGCA